MAQYLLSIYQPDGDPPPPETLDPIIHNVEAWQARVRGSGAWVFSGGLHPPDTATVVRATADGHVTTDGSFVEGEEHLGGFTVIEVPDIDEALKLGRALSEATTLPIEVRPLLWGSCA